MLVIGKAGTEGGPERVVPVLRGGAPVATRHASRWREAATAWKGTHWFLAGGQQIAESGVG